MQKFRIACQIFFLLLTLVAVFIVNGNAEIWCPFGGIEAVYTYWYDGTMPCSLGVSNFYILIAILVITFLIRRVFCGYVCPIGTLSYWIGKFGRKYKLGPVQIPIWLDRILSLIKYIVLFVILWFTYRTGELWFRGIDPCYALISRHGEDITILAYIIAGIIALGSLLVSLPFCRWGCPFAAVLNPISCLGFSIVKRDPKICVACGKCSKVCPMAIPVADVNNVSHARCLSCLECVDRCPKSGALKWSFPQPVLFVILFVLLAGAVITYELNPLPSFIQEHGTATKNNIAKVTLDIENLTCRGRANLLFYFLNRDDMFQISGYIRLEAWPAPDKGRAVIYYESDKSSAPAIISAITEPYCEGQDFSTFEQHIRESPFVIK